MTTTEITPCEECQAGLVEQAAEEAAYKAWLAGMTPEDRADYDAYQEYQEKEWEEHKTTPDYDSRWEDVPYTCPRCGLEWE